MHIRARGNWRRCFSKGFELLVGSAGDFVGLFLQLRSQNLSQDWGAAKIGPYCRQLHVRRQSSTKKGSKERKRERAEEADAVTETYCRYGGALRGCGKFK